MVSAYFFNLVLLPPHSFCVVSACARLRHCSCTVYTLTYTHSLSSQLLCSNLLLFLANCMQTEFRELLDKLFSWCDLCLPANEQSFAESHRLKIQKFQVCHMYCDSALLCTNNILATIGLMLPASCTHAVFWQALLHIGTSILKCALKSDILHC
jgi:hypothetical protein